MNGSKSTNLDSKSEGGESGEKNACITTLQHINLGPPVLRRPIPEPLKCNIATPLRPTFPSPRPVIATIQPNAVPISGASVISTNASNMTNTTKPGVLQSGSTLALCPPMASIIRGPVGTHSQPSFGSHGTHPAIQATYSSHLPKGAAAVACITTLKSAVATPIPRSHILASNVVTSSTGTHHIMQPRLSGINPIRGPISTITKPNLSSLASDISHSTITTTSNPSPAPIVLASSRTTETTLRPAVVHGAALISKSHSFVQHIQQVTAPLEKGFYRPNVSPATILPVQSTASTSNVTPHVTAGQQISSLQSVAVTLPSTLALPSSTTQIHLPIHQQLVSHSITLTGSPVTNLAPTIVSSTVAHPNLSKVIPHSVTPITHFQSANLSGQTRAIKTVVTQCSAKSMVSPGVTSLSTPLPVAKVSPQKIAVVTRPTSEITPHDSVRNPTQTTLFVSPTQRASTTHLSVASNPTTSSSVIPVSASVNSSATSNIVLADNRSERQNVGGSSYNFSPGTTYFYEPNTLTMHPLTGSSTSSHTFTAVPANIRAGFMTPSPTSTLPVHQTTMRPTSVNSVNVNPVMMTVTSARNPQLLSTLPESTTLSTDSVTTVVSSANSSVAYSGNPAISSSPASNTSSSPRPSILRKRANDGSQVSSAVKRNLLTCLSPSKVPVSKAEQSVGTKANVSSKLPSERENGQASESTSTANICMNTQIKLEPLDSSDIAVASANLLQLGLGPCVEASPRKKPRKQQLTGNELVETHSTEGEDEFEKDTKEIVKKEPVQEETNRGGWISRKNRSPVTLLNSYRHTWKSRHNHFIKYSDIKPKDERRPTLFELVNQKWVTQKVRGWKVYHLCAQMEDVVDLEGSAHARLMSLLEEMEKKDKGKDDEDLDLNRTIELMRGNIQRCKLIRDQMKDAKHQVLKVMEHSSRVSEIVNKYVPKQSSRRRDKQFVC